MKIYRAKFKYNNNESCEYEEWHEQCSPWYTDKALAEKHIPFLTEFKDYLCYTIFQHQYNNFKYIEPFIEETEVYDSLQNMKLVNDIVDITDDEFKGFKYISYNDKCEITKQEFEHFGPSWVVYITIDNSVVYRVRFASYFDNFKIEPISSIYFIYNKEDRDKLDNIVSKMANNIFSFYKNYKIIDKKYREMLDNSDDEKRDEAWTNMWKNELHTLIYMFTELNITFTKCGEDRCNNKFVPLFKNKGKQELLELTDVLLAVGDKNNVKK